jgi:hypothetical protein
MHSRWRLALAWLHPGSRWVKFCGYEQPVTFLPGQRFVPDSHFLEQELQETKLVVALLPGRPD